MERSSEIKCRPKVLTKLGKLAAYQFTEVDHYCDYYYNEDNQCGQEFDQSMSIFREKFNFYHLNSDCESNHLVQPDVLDVGELKKLL